MMTKYGMAEILESQAKIFIEKQFRDFDESAKGKVFGSCFRLHTQKLSVFKGSGVRSEKDVRLRDWLIRRWHSRRNNNELMHSRRISRQA